MPLKGSVTDKVKVTAVKSKLTGTIGGLTDHLITLRERKRELEESIKGIELEISTLSDQLMEKLDAEGTDKGAGKLGSCSISTTVVPNVDDWDVFYAYIHKNKYYHLLQRRTSDAACRELFEQKGSIPGVTPFNKRRLNLRTA